MNFVGFSLLYFPLLQKFCKLEIGKKNFLFRQYFLYAETRENLKDGFDVLYIVSKINNEGLYAVCKATVL